jgi:hypothetical protein
MSVSHLHPLVAWLALGLSGAGAAPGVSDAPALARALEAVRTEHVGSDIRFIASDDLEGRDTPSQGLRKAARYIRARLMRLGFAPGGDEGSYFHRYRMARTALDEAATEASFTRDGATTELVFGRDYYFWPSGVANLERSGEVVFVGRASAEEVASLDLHGKFALAYEEGSSREGRRRNQRGRGTRLEERGAVGLIVAADPAGEQEPFGGERYAEWVKRGRLDVDLGEENAVWPQLSVSADVARALVAGLGPSPRVGAPLGVTFRDVRASKELEGYDLENVAGLWPGSDPELAREVIVVSAHYDHIGLEGAESRAPGEDRINNGADDNGSGTCGMLAIAEALQVYGPMRRSVLLLWVSGEEKGLKGSAAWTKRPSLPDGWRVVANLNIDMIGRNAPDQLMITPTAEHEAYNFLTRMAEKAAPLEGFPVLGGCDEFWARSDQMNFAENLGVPVAFLFSGEHEDYHGPGDHADKIDFDKVRRVARLVVRMLDGLQGDELGAE